MAKTKEIINRGKRLRALREQMNLTRSQFAYNMGVSEHTLKSLENGARELTEVGAREYSRRFLLAGIDVSFDFLYYGNNPENLRQEERIMDDEQNIQKEILSFKENNPLSIILKIQDSLMSPFFNKGDIVGGQKITDESRFFLFANHICIIETPDGAQCLRRVLKSEHRKVMVCALNADASNNLPLIEEREAFSLAQATRHWRLSSLIRNLHDGNF